MEDEDGDNNSRDNSNDRCSFFLFFFPRPCFHLGPDGERQTEGTDTSRKRDARSSAGHHKSEDTSDSREDEAAVSLSLCFSFFFFFF